MTIDNTQADTETAAWLARRMEGYKTAWLAEKVIAPFRRKATEELRAENERLREALDIRAARIDAVYEICAQIADHPAAPGIAKKIREEAAWEGLDCSCGGGWKVGHLSGCPEALSNKDEPV